MKRKYEIRITNRRSRSSTGSALILTVVLVSLLAVVGVMFVMVARVDKISTSAIIENKELNLAVDSVIAKLSQQLILDTPGIIEPNQPMQEYYDYPDSANRWLASLEPYDGGINYRWRRISDVYNVPGTPLGILESLETLGLQDVDDETAGPDNLVASIVLPSDEVTGAHELGNPANYITSFGGPADADGDGVTDSRWIQLPNMTSSKGKSIFAAIRVIDSGAMLNVNTAYKFDPNTAATATDIDGSSQTQVDLLTLAERGVNPNALLSLDNERYGFEPHNLNNYIVNVVWRYNKPNGAYTPFDISDELELRNRFLINLPAIDTRIEEVWNSAFQIGLRTPVDSNLPGWFCRANNRFGDPNYDPEDYDYRHIGTIYNMDRIIDPNGNKMLNVNTAEAGDIFDTLVAIRTADPNNFLITDADAAQMAVNLRDFCDSNDPNLPLAHPLYDPDNDVSDYTTLSGNTYYGFERPCIYISELAHRFEPTPLPNITYKSYAIELHKPYFEDDDPDNWQLVIDNPPRTVPITWSGIKRFHVIKWEHSRAPLDVIFIDPGVPVDSNYIPTAQSYDNSASDIIFQANSKIQLQRFVQGVGYITVDDINVPGPGPSGWLREGPRARSFQRDITSHKCIRRLWDASFSNVDSPTLGRMNAYGNGDLVYIQAQPANKPFTNIGEIGMVFRRGAYYNPNRPAERAVTIGYDLAVDHETEVRINLADSDVQQMFKYLTVFDPVSDFIDNDGDGLGIDGNGDGWLDVSEVDLDELKVPGRININTAPWFVIAQLPWVSDHTPNFDLARAIVDYRDNIAGAFENIGELMRVTDTTNFLRSIDYYGRDVIDQPGFPDLTPGDNMVDNAADDFEERDVIFSRISNLVTVRSDVFTAYILVRIGTDGPQKRVIAILDRSDVYPLAGVIGGKVKLVALHPVPDPR